MVAIITQDFYEKPELEPGDNVCRVDSYTFRGVVLAVFRKLKGLELAGKWLVAVEIPAELATECQCENCQDPNGAGMVHIFTPFQLRKI